MQIPHLLALGRKAQAVRQRVDEQPRVQLLQVGRAAGGADLRGAPLRRWRQRGKPA